MKKPIYGATIISGVIQMLEAGIGIAIVVTVGKYILDMLGSTDLLDYIRGVFQQIVVLFGSKFTALFLSAFLGIILIYLGRWAISWSSTNGGQTPNNRGN